VFGAVATSPLNEVPFGRRTSVPTFLAAEDREPLIEVLIVGLRVRVLNG